MCPAGLKTRVATRTEVSDVRGEIIANAFILVFVGGMFYMGRRLRNVHVLLHVTLYGPVPWR